MTNSALLREKIAASGYKLKYIASRLGLTYQGFLNKLNGESEFKVSETAQLRNLLKLSGEDMDAIFFAQSVDKMST